MSGENRAPADTARNERVLSEIVEMVTSATGSPITALTGPLGIGRSALLSQLEPILIGTGIRTVTLRLSPNPLANPLHAALLSVARRSGDDPHSASTRPSTSPLLGSPAATTPEQTAAAIAQPLLSEGSVAILVDDAQWIDAPSLAILESLARQIAGTTVRCVCAIRVPVPSPLLAAGRDTFERMRREGLLSHVNVRPLGTADIAALGVVAFGAKPDQELVSGLRRLTAGLPAALVPVIEQYQGTGSIRIVDGYAHLVRQRRDLSLPEHHPLVMNVRRLGSRLWTAAKAVSVLCQLGESVPTLLSEFLDIKVSSALELLDELQEAAVLQRSRTGRGWRFRVPLLASALSTHLGPYERRHLAQRTITALWQKKAQCEDEDFPADQLAIAGKLVDPERARTQLVRHATAAIPANGDYNDLWLRSAAALPTGQQDQARILLVRVAMSLARGDYGQTLLHSDTVRRELGPQLTDDELVELDRAQVLALHGTGDLTAVERIADDPSRRDVIGRATALQLLGRWHECGTLLDAQRDSWTKIPMSAFFGHFLEAQTHFVSGRYGLVKAHIDDAYRRLPEHSALHRADLRGFELLVSLLTGVAGELSSERSTLFDSALPPAIQAILASDQGRFDQAMTLARRTIAGGAVYGHELAHTFLHRSAAMIQLSRGKLSRGRELLRLARESRPPLPHLLDCAEALLDRTLGQTDQARQQLRRGLTYAAAHGLVIEADELWRQLAELEVKHGDVSSAHACLAEIERVASLTGTDSALLNRSLAAALVEQDHAAAEEAIRLARKRDRPFELGNVLAKLVAHQLCDPALLYEAYELADDLDALLHRAWLRNLMQHHDLSIPGRKQTVAENERLLATLVADGLSNKQIALVLRASEKSVESRLARLFARTGVQSRVELAMSVINGAHDTAWFRVPQ
ncbi:AAA family ATPase [Amycolatopsis sp. NPDC049868]|uniref:ATP-binding protein n=1 Tax=Amycolatopsis sp. NPDC049868 TaxID=3363934 RepID=UPI0037911C9F